MYIWLLLRDCLLNTLHCVPWHLDLAPYRQHHWSFAPLPFFLFFFFSYQIFYSFFKFLSHVISLTLPSPSSLLNSRISHVTSLPLITCYNVLMMPRVTYHACYGTLGFKVEALWLVNGLLPLVLLCMNLDLDATKSV